MGRRLLTTIFAVLLVGCGGGDGPSPLPSPPSAASPTPAPPSSSPDTDPEWLRSLAADYPHVYQAGNVRVFSDLDASFSREHAEHLKRVWDFFNSLYARNRGPRLDAYYTTRAPVFEKVVPHCPTIFVPGARNLTACYLDYPRWFILPYQLPDFGTQLHEIGHDFLYVTWPGSEDFPWFKEGTGMYFEAGVFASDGSLAVPRPDAYCTTLFRRYDQQGRLIPLAQLLRLPKAAFLADNERTYSQSCMLINHLQGRDGGFLRAVVEGINSGAITSNEQLIQRVLERSGQSLEQLQSAYEAYGRSVALAHRDS